MRTLMVPFGSSIIPISKRSENRFSTGFCPSRLGAKCPTPRANPGRAGGGCHWAHPPMSKINLRHHSPPHALTGRENNVRGNYPSNAWNDSKTAVLRQLPRPAAAVLSLTRRQRHCRYTEWVYRQCQEGRGIVPMGLRQCKLALARTQGCTLHCARLRSPKCKFALQRMQT